MPRLLPALAAVALLAACTGPTGTAPQETTPPGPSYAPDIPLPEALRSNAATVYEAGLGAAWESSDRGSFVVVIYGSSSCAPSPVSLTTTDSRTLALGFMASTDEICSADMAANTFRFDAPAAVARDGDVDLVITITRSEGDQSTTVPMLPAASG